MSARKGIVMTAEQDRRLVVRQRRVLPAAPKVSVEVTGEIIEKSVRKDSSHCMISDAVAAAVPDAKFISVDIQTIRFSRGKFRYTYLTPRKGQVELIKFDQGEEIEPFSFQLRPQGAQTTRSGARTGVKTGNPQPRTEAQRAATRKAMAASTKPFGPRETAKLVRGSGAQNNVPDVRGGKTPPMAPLASGATVPRARRRAYGLCALET
jgi:hypothetical protein